MKIPPVIKDVAGLALTTSLAQVLAVAMLPFYTRTLSTAEYGVIDLLVSLVALFGPIVSLGMGDAILRFGMNWPECRPAQLSTGIVVGLGGTALATPILLALRPGGAPPLVLAATVSLLVMQVLVLMIGQYARATGRLGTYAGAGLAGGLASVAAGFGLVVWGGFGVFGYLAASALAALVNVILLARGTAIWRVFGVRSFEIRTARTMLSYSLPLVPNVVLWWASNSLTRLLMINYNGASAAGVYAVAMRMPSLLALGNAVLAQAVQRVAFKPREPAQQAAFFSHLMHVFSAAMFIVVSLALTIVKPVLNLLVGPAFYDSWRFVPLLFMAATIMSFAQLLGTSYLMDYNTRGVLYSAVPGATVGLVSGLLLVPSFGGYGASLSMVLGNGTVLVLRVIGRSRRGIRAPVRFWIAGFGLLSAQAVTLYRGWSPSQEIAVGVCSVGWLLALSAPVLLPVVRALFRGGVSA